MLKHIFFVVVVHAAFCVVRNDGSYVTCGSIIKLLNMEEEVRLHSHDVKYGSGSGQQSITGMPEADDTNSHWQVMGSMTKRCHRGDTVKCGDKIRLKHLTTGCYLHSHLFNAPLSRGNQEVSCFGREDEGDTGDHWLLLCDSGVWRRDEPVRLKHEDTGKYLATSGHQYGRPISGQREVVGVSSSSKSALWKTAEGVYMIRSKDGTHHEVLNHDAVKETCFEDADDKSTVCQVETTTQKQKKPTRSTMKQHYSKPRNVYAEENFMYSTWLWFSDERRSISSIIWWISKCLFCAFFTYLVFPDLWSALVGSIVLIIVVSSYLWFMGS